MIRDNYGKVPSPTMAAAMIVIFCLHPFTWMSFWVAAMITWITWHRGIPLCMGIFPMLKLAVRTSAVPLPGPGLCAAVANISAAVPGQEVRRLTAVLGGYNGTPHWKESFKQKTNVPHATVTESAHLCLLQYWNFTSFKGCKTLRPSSQMSCFIVALSGLPPNHHPKVSSLLFTAIIFAIFVAICWGQCRLIPRGTISLWTRDVESSSTAKKNNRAALLFP